MPGVAKNLACRIVSHREGHEFSANSVEPAEVKGLPAAALGRIRQRVTLAVPGELEKEPVRRLKAGHITRPLKRPCGYTKKFGPPEIPTV
jgi:hypothetical protein